MTPETFKSHRAKLGLSQQSLAEQWGLTRLTIIRYENGHTPIPKVAALLIDIWAASGATEI